MMAFRDWLEPKTAIVEDNPPCIRQTIATIATIAEQESTKQLNDNDQEAQEDADWHEFLYGKPTEELLFNHLIDCQWCHIEQAQYCLYGNELGKQYDALLLKNEHAQEKRAALSFQVDRAKITGNRRYMPFVPAPF